MSEFYKGKKVLVTGGTGMIGRFLVDQLVAAGAEVRSMSLDHLTPNEEVQYRHGDLRDVSTCRCACADMDYVFHLAGVKGSPKMAAEKPASFFDPIIGFSLNMLRAAHEAGVERYLLTSSIGVYGPIYGPLQEDSMWKSDISPNDRFGGWAKRTTELQVEAYRKQYGWEGISIVRPANVYGPFDNFDPETAMVIPSLIARAIDGHNPLKVWGDGSPIRDFVHASDVARAMMMVMESGEQRPVNIGSGSGVSIRDVTELLRSAITGLEIEWVPTDAKGDDMRVLDITRLESLGYKVSATMPLARGIAGVVKWYRENCFGKSGRYDPFGGA